jgi:hypothetical protein
MAEFRSKTQHWERRAFQDLRLRLGQCVSHEVLHSSTTCSTVQGNILFRFQLSQELTMLCRVKSMMTVSSEIIEFVNKKAGGYTETS